MAIRMKDLALATGSLFTFLLVNAWPPTLQAAAINNSECMDCHGDASLARGASQGMKNSLFVDFSKFKYSLHNINGVTCVDCHADIKELDTSKDVPHSTQLAPVQCAKCHEEQSVAYQNSVHRKAGTKGISIPCFACHDYHYITRLEGKTVPERENSFCLKCHDPGKFHDWLPQKETHFAHVECTVCHAPDTPRQLRLQFYDLVNQKILSSQEILTALGTDTGAFMNLLDTDKDGRLSAEEFEDMVLLLRQRGARVTFHGELVSNLQPIIHQVNRGGAKGQCELCHVPASPFFEAVSISLQNGDDFKNFPVERKVLETYHVSHFYALGGTRVRLLDQVGLGLMAGGVGVVLLHLSVRVATIPKRRRAEEKKPSNR